MIVTSGNQQKEDVFVEIDTNNTGIEITLKTKFPQLFGDHLNQMVKAIVDNENLKNAKISIIDDGALDFVFVARLKSAFLKLSETTLENKGA